MSETVPWTLGERPIPPDTLDSTPWRSAGARTGDSRYFVVADTLDAIREEFDRTGAVFLMHEISDALRRGLAATRAAADAHAGAKVAERMHNEVVNLLDQGRAEIDEAFRNK